MMIIGPKFPVEIKVATFAFAQHIGSATLQSVVIACKVISGIDPAPENMIFGPSLIQGTNLVSQRFTGGIHGTKYLLTATGTDSNGLVHVVYAVMSVREPGR